MNKITSLALEGIAIHPKRMRALRKETVKALAKSMAVHRRSELVRGTLSPGARFPDPIEPMTLANIREPREGRPRTFRRRPANILR